MVAASPTKWENDPESILRIPPGSLKIGAGGLPKLVQEISIKDVTTNMQKNLIWGQQSLKTAP